MKTIEDAVRELDGDWNNAINFGQHDCTCLWFDDLTNPGWRVIHPDSWVANSSVVYTKEQFEEAAKKYHKEKVQPYIPQAGDWFLFAHKKDEAFLEHKYLCIGRDTQGNIVYEDSNGNIHANNTENYKFKQHFLSTEEEWKMQAYVLLGTVSEPKDVIHKIYRALVSGKLSIPK